MQSVTQNANSFVSTIVDTDWQKELASLKDEIKDDLQAGQAAATDAGVVDAHDAARSRSAQGTAVHEAAAPGGTAFSFATLSKSLMTGTAEILEQVLLTLLGCLHACVHVVLQNLRCNRPVRADCARLPRNKSSTIQHGAGCR